MGDVAAQAIATHLTKLVKLKADGMPMLTDDGVEVLAKGVPRFLFLLWCIPTLRDTCFCSFQGSTGCSCFLLTGCSVDSHTTQS